MKTDAADAKQSTVCKNKKNRNNKSSRNLNICTVLYCETQRTDKEGTEDRW